jgi:hypothetical protein
MMLLGTVALVAFALRSMSHTWTFGAYELWVLPLGGLTLLLLGRLMIG